MMPERSIPKANFESPCLEKLDRLKWVMGFCVGFSDGVLGVRCDCPQIGLKLLEIAQRFGTVVDSVTCDSLISLKTGAGSQRRGLRHYNLLYSNHVVMLRTMNLDDCLKLFDDLVEVASITMSERLVHVDDSRLFGWEADDRVFSLVGPDDACRAIVAGLRPYLMPERTSFTTFCGQNLVVFSPLDDKWRGRLIQKPLPLSGLIFLDQPGKTLPRSQAILRLFELSSGPMAPSERIGFLSQGLQHVPFYTLEIGELAEMPQRFANLLDLGVAARDIRTFLEFAR